MNLKEREKYVLKLVNKERKAHGMGSTSRLKRGVPKHLSACTLMMTLPPGGPGYSCLYGRSEMTPDGDLSYSYDGLYYTDPEVERFVTDYDAGKYPHLEIPKSVVKIKGVVV